MSSWEKTGGSSMEQSLLESRGACRLVRCLVSSKSCTSWNPCPYEPHFAIFYLDPLAPAIICTHPYPWELSCHLYTVYVLIILHLSWETGSHTVSLYPLWFPVWFGQWEGWAGEQRVGVKVDDRLFLLHWLLLWHHGLRWLYLFTTTAPAWSPGFEIPAIFQIWQHRFLPLFFRPGMVLAPSCRQSLGAMPIFMGPLIVPASL